MRNSIYIAIVLMMGLSSCSSQKKLETTAPFKLGAASSQEWVGGIEAAGSGYTITVAMEQVSPTATLEDIYFRGQLAKVNMEEVEGKMYCKAKFTKENSAKPDIISHKDPKKEVGNQPPALKKRTAKEFPFELERNEAILRYREGKKVRYIKIPNVKELAPRAYSSIQQD